MMSLFSLKLIHTSNYFSKIVNSNLSVQFLFIDKTDSLEVLVVVIGLSQSQAPSMNQWSYCCCCTDKWWPRWSLYWDVNKSMKSLVTEQFLKEMQILAKCHFQFLIKVESILSQICRWWFYFLPQSLPDLQQCSGWYLWEHEYESTIYLQFFSAERILMIEILACERISNIFKVRTERLAIKKKFWSVLSLLTNSQLLCPFLQNFQTYERQYLL